MKTRGIFFPVLILIASQMGEHLAAQDPSALVVMQKSDEQSKAHDERADLTMLLVNSGGKERTRKVQWVTKTDARNNRSSLIRFLSPADVEGTGFLSLEYAGREDDQWLYLPALKKVRRISASNETDNFIGSDFTYEDLDREDLDQYAYTSLGAEKIDNADCYVVQAVPNNEQKKKESGYSKRSIYVRKDNFTVVQTKYYDKNGELLKVLRGTDVRLAKGTDKWRAYRLELNNLRTGHKTILTFQNVAINRGIDQEFFTQRYLERAN
ncbi:MAG: outer membrane lipoprotein-sorting protein [Ferruginibacter sp.]|nr:outer membrane lipoprotein-sorting protein [Cytophagales bacterium]